ncbi:hypothetical protein L211DRAFT_445181 [Terfezia boudieri ATCC MYA-4762]|uniref:Uncharacterized protein n=1 Tax=Terfezia boudieri ATCC MYA-4762 TaxID=1051890 RepID=A0A3N4LKN2_9PEZI|nr:hypothetical protein L211DRAFT_445181 [Terfezia boudieri ATCC MYA-4762]
MGFFSNLIGFVQSHIPFSSMGIVTTPPGQNIPTEEGIKKLLFLPTGNKPKRRSRPEAVRPRKVSPRRPLR